MIGSTVLCGLVISLLSVVAVSAMMLPSGYQSKGGAVWSKCKWVCENDPHSSGYCPCYLYNGLVKRPYDLYSQEMPILSRDASFLNYIFGLKSSIQEDSDKPRTQKRGQVDGNNIVSHFQDTDADRRHRADLNMVRSKKRWLSLHDQFDSQDRDGDMVVPDLWKEDASRKAFRYG